MADAIEAVTRKRNTLDSPSSTLNNPGAPKCVFCSQVLDISYTPKLLECLHVSCAQCVQMQLFEIEHTKPPVIHCALCGLPSHNNLITDNHFLIEQYSLIGYTDALDDSSKVPPENAECRNCSEKAVTSFWCEQCFEYICTNCARAHQRLNIVKDHNIRPKHEAKLSKTIDKLYMCQQHPQEKLSMFCQTCNTLTCRDCQLKEHRYHTYDFVKNFAPEVRELVSKIVAEINKFDYQLTCSQEAVRSQHAEINAMKTKAFNDITKMVNKLMAAVNQRGTDLYAHVDEACESKKKQLTEKMNVLQMISKSKNHCIEFVNNVLKNGSNHALLASKKSMLQQLLRLQGQCGNLPQTQDQVHIQVDFNSLDHLVNDIKKLGNFTRETKSYKSNESLPSNGPPPQYPSNGPTPRYPAIQTKPQETPSGQPPPLNPQYPSNAQPAQYTPRGLLPQYLSNGQQPAQCPPYIPQHVYSNANVSPGIPTDTTSNRPSGITGAQDWSSHHNNNAQQIPFKNNQMNHNYTADVNVVLGKVPQVSSCQGQSHVTSSTHPQSLDVSLRDLLNQRGPPPNSTFNGTQKQPHFMRAPQTQQQQQFMHNSANGTNYSNFANNNAGFQNFPQVQQQNPVDTRWLPVITSQMLTQSLIQHTQPIQQPVQNNYEPPNKKQRIRANNFTSTHAPMPQSTPLLQPNGHQNENFRKSVNNFENNTDPRSTIATNGPQVNYMNPSYVQSTQQSNIECTRSHCAPEANGPQNLEALFNTPWVTPHTFPSPAYTPHPPKTPQLQSNGPQDVNLQTSVNSVENKTHQSSTVKTNVTQENCMNTLYEQPAHQTNIEFHQSHKNARPNESTALPNLAALLQKGPSQPFANGCRSESLSTSSHILENNTRPSSIAATHGLQGDITQTQQTQNQCTAVVTDKLDVSTLTERSQQEPITASGNGVQSKIAENSSKTLENITLRSSRASTHTLQGDSVSSSNVQRALQSNTVHCQSPCTEAGDTAAAGPQQEPPNQYSTSTQKDSFENTLENNTSSNNPSTVEVLQGNTEETCNQHTVLASSKSVDLETIASEISSAVNHSSPEVQSSAFVIKSEDPNEDWCAVCMDGGDLVCCDYCPKVFHQNCHIPTIILPDENTSWQCLLCTKLKTLAANPELTKKNPGELSPLELLTLQKICLVLCSQYEQSLNFRESESPTNTAYYEVISNPMSLNVIRSRLDPSSPNHYKNIQAFVSDVRLIFKNTYFFYQKESFTYTDAKYLEKIFEEQLSQCLPEYALKSDNKNKNNKNSTTSSSDITNGSTVGRASSLESEVIIILD